MDWPTRPTWIRIALGAGVVISAVCLLAMLGVGPFGGDGPALARNEILVEIVDGNGRPLRSATAYVMRRPGEASVQERWDPEEAVLGLPAGGPARSLLVTAPGFQILRVGDVIGSRRIALEGGLRVRIRLRNAPKRLEPKHVRFLIRIRPAQELTDATQGLDSSDLVALMDHVAGPRSGPKGLPRGAFGYAVSRTQAKAGILVPKPGRYHVHWGLMNVKAGTWFSLGDVCGRELAVHSGQESYEIDVTEADLQRTLEELATSVNRLEAD